MRKIFGFQIVCKITNFFITKSGILKVNLKLNGVFQKMFVSKQGLKSNFPTISTLTAMNAMEINRIFYLCTLDKTENKMQF